MTTALAYANGTLQHFMSGDSVTDREVIDAAAREAGYADLDDMLESVPGSSEDEWEVVRTDAPLSVVEAFYTSRRGSTTLRDAVTSAYEISDVEADRLIAAVGEIDDDIDAASMLDTLWRDEAWWSEGDMRAPATVEEVADAIREQSIGRIASHVIAGACDGTDVSIDSDEDSDVETLRRDRAVVVAWAEPGLPDAEQVAAEMVDVYTDSDVYDVEIDESVAYEVRTRVAAWASVALTAGDTSSDETRAA